MVNRVTMDDFKENKVLIGITIFFSILTFFGASLKPEYLDEQSALVTAVIGLPLISLWFHLFWNRILLKVFNLKPISYGVAVILTAATAIILG